MHPLVLLAAALAAGAPAAGGPDPAAAAAGERIFSGEVRFANGGPPCASCHDVAALRFPGGGDLGPDLTGAYARYGAEPLDVVLTTLFFPTMNPVFLGRPLTPAERSQLAAFLQASGGRAPRANVSWRMLAYGVLAAAAAAGALAWLGRTRLGGVRAALVRARSSRRAPP